MFRLAAPLTPGYSPFFRDGGGSTLGQGRKAGRRCESPWRLRCVATPRPRMDCGFPPEHAHPAQRKTPPMKRSSTFALTILHDLVGRRAAAGARHAGAAGGDSPEQCPQGAQREELRLRHDQIPRVPEPIRQRQGRTGRTLWPGAYADRRPRQEVRRGPGSLPESGHHQGVCRPGAGELLRRRVDPRPGVERAGPGRREAERSRQTPGQRPSALQRGDPVFHQRDPGLDGEGGESKRRQNADDRSRMGRPRSLRFG